MGKRGPKPMPNHLKVLQGETRPSRLNENEPIPSMEDVVKPSYLSDEAGKVWDEVAPDREAKGVLTTWDVPAFAAFCEALVILRTAHTEPASVWRTAISVSERLGSRFGWTPGDRANLRMVDPDEDEDDPFDGPSRYIGSGSRYDRTGRLLP